MVATVSINPMQTTNASGSFNVQSQGYIQGTALNDPAVRNALAGGFLSDDETLPMWGGVGISETTAPTGTGATLPNGSLGGEINRATSLTATAALGLTGFSVFDQNHSMITSPQSPVPLAASSMGVNFYRLGSGARIAVAIDPILVNLEGNIISQQVSWDFVNQRLTQYAPAYAANTITGAVWAATGGGQITFTVSTDPSSALTAGDVINVIDVVNTGGASTDAFNGAWTVVSTTSSTIVVSAPASATLGTYASGGTVVAGGGALACKILDVQIDNSLTVSYDEDTGFATWNRSGSTAIILI